MKKISNIFGLAGTTLLILCLSIISYIFIPDFLWIHLPFHSAIEASGGCIAIVLAIILMIYRAYDLDREESYTHIFTASALISMGLLDFFHACVIPGNTFVFLHSFATFVGGVFFAMIWIPLGAVSKRKINRIPVIVFIVTLLFGIFAVIWQDTLPMMLEDERFTITAKAYNVIGGIMFLAASLKFMLRHRNMKRRYDILLSHHCLLFGIAGIIFEQSELWDTNWWLWHSLRLAAYNIVLIFIFILLRRIMHNYNSINDYLKTKLGELEHANSELNNFNHVVSHDLKNPMTNIVGRSEILMSEYSNKLDEKATNHLDCIIRNVTTMNELLDGLLMQPFSDKRINEQVNVNKIIEQIIFENSDQIHSNDVEIRFNNDLPTVYFPKTKLYQIFSNLIKNAIKFRKEGVTSEIKIGYNENDDEYIFFVSDNGIGIDAKDFDKVFRMFSRVKSKDVEGTGLGLSIVEKIIKDHDGRIWIESELNKGSKFYFTIKKGQQLGGR